MGEENFDFKTHERLRQRAVEKADSLLCTFKSYYKAAEWYEDIDRILDWAVIFISVVLTTGLFLEKIPAVYLILLAVSIAVFSALKRVIRTRELAVSYYKAARAYHGLFDEFKDFIDLKLSKKEVGLEEMFSEFRKLSEKRRTLNNNTPDISSKWYEKLDESIYEEVLSSENAQEKIGRKAKLIDKENKEVRKEGDRIDPRNNSSEVE